jgi:hypothetical protein
LLHGRKTKTNGARLQTGRIGSSGTENRQRVKSQNENENRSLPARYLRRTWPTGSKTESKKTSIDAVCSGRDRGTKSLPREAERESENQRQKQSLVEDPRRKNQNRETSLKFLTKCHCRISSKAHEKLWQAETLHTEGTALRLHPDKRAEHKHQQQTKIRKGQYRAQI